MTTPSQKSRWQVAYNRQLSPQELEGGVRQFNGYRHPRTHALLMNSLRKATRGWQNLNILDAGCGSGDTGSFLTANNQVTGLDFSQRMAHHAKQVYNRMTLGDVEQLPFADNSFDALLATGVWQCLAPDTPFLHEVARVVKSGGEAIFGWVLNRDYLLYRKGVTFRLDPQVKMNLLTATELPSLLAEAGLQITRLYSVLFPLGVINSQKAPLWLRSLVPAYTVHCRIEKNL